MHLIVYSMPTIGKCDVNGDNGQSVVTYVPPGAGWWRWPKWKVQSTINDDCQLLIAFGVQLSSSS